MQVRESIRKFRLMLYWGIPPVILYIIFNRIDFEQLMEIVSKANAGLIFIGIFFIFCKIIPGAFRWHLLTKGYGCTRLTLWRSIAEYWISLTLGIIVPGSLGSDAYRVTLGGQQTGLYLRGAFVIGIEKLAALFSCAVMIAGLYPFLLIETLPDAVSYTLDAAYIFLMLSFSIIIFAALTHRSEWFNKFVDTFARKISGLAKKIERKVNRQRMNDNDNVTDRSPLELFYFAFKPRLILPTIFLSFAIHAIGAVQSQLFFQALGYDIPFLINLFVAPLILLAFTLPISFGGIGIREGTYIFFYGAFGVPAEIALVVSFCGLSSVLLGHAIGTVLIFARPRQVLIKEKPVHELK